MTADGTGSGDDVRGQRHEWMGFAGRHDDVDASSLIVMVDAAENPANLAAVRAANVDAVGYLGRAVRTCGATLVHISSEYVFDGRHEGPHPEDWPANPLSVYGQSKADGDLQAGYVTKHYLVRTTWVAGEGGNFVRTR